LVPSLDEAIEIRQTRANLLRRIRQKRVSLLCRMRQTPRRWQRRAHESVAVGLPPSYGWNV
jgi:hypothetical protein